MYDVLSKSKACGHAHLHYVYKHHTKYESCSSKTVGGDSRTNHVSISGRTDERTDERTDRDKLICPPTLRRGGIPILTQGWRA